MPKYRVEMTVACREYRKAFAHIEADSPEQAEAKMLEMYDNGEVETHLDYVDEEEVLHDFTEAKEIVA